MNPTSTIEGKQVQNPESKISDLKEQMDALKKQLAEKESLLNQLLPGQESSPLTKAQGLEDLSTLEAQGDAHKIAKKYFADSNKTTEGSSILDYVSYINKGANFGHMEGYNPVILGLVKSNNVAAAGLSILGNMTGSLQRDGKSDTGAELLGGYIAKGFTKADYQSIIKENQTEAELATSMAKLEEIGRKLMAIIDTLQQDSAITVFRAFLEKKKIAQQNDTPENREKIARSALESLGKFAPGQVSSTDRLNIDILINKYPTVEKLNEYLDNTKIARSALEGVG
ncbi:MAG: hypothetical protein H7230_00350, partial [Candidatus Parcubacteria bacterium]|nr:hypothetical protein [Candidatus Paceibacterota bacterium]